MDITVIHNSSTNQTSHCSWYFKIQW